MLSNKGTGVRIGSFAAQRGLLYPPQEPETKFMGWVWADQNLLFVTAERAVDKEKARTTVAEAAPMTNRLLSCII